MRPIQIIRLRLGVTQQEMAAGIGCGQSGISYYERGGHIAPETAKRLIEFAQSRGLQISFDHVYGAADVPHIAQPAAAV
jgi:putative transcriptional regulator